MASRKTKTKTTTATTAMIGMGVRVIWADAAAKESWHTAAELGEWIKEGLPAGPTYGILHKVTTDFIVVVSTRLGHDYMCHAWKIPTKWIRDILVVDPEPPT